jgi:hypothetical protein
MLELTMRPDCGGSIRLADHELVHPRLTQRRREGELGLHVDFDAANSAHSNDTVTRTDCPMAGL